MNKMESVAVRSTLYRDIYRKRGYQVTYCPWDTLPFFLLLESFCPPVCKSNLQKITRFFLKIYQYLILHFVVKRYDGIIIMKYFSYDTVKLIRKNTKAKLLYDFDDALWLKIHRPLLAEYDKIIACVDYVSVDNDFLYRVAKKYNDNVFLFPPPAQFEALPEKYDKADDETIIIGWIGSGATSYYLYSLHSVLEKLGEKYPKIKLLILGFSFNILPFFEKINWELIPEYNVEIMNKARRQIDIGLFPLIPCENSLGRGYLKAVLYMGASIPVVATDYGVLPDLIQDGVNGFLCHNESDWFNKLSLLIEDVVLRKKIGNAGFETVKVYSLENCFQQLEDHFLSKL